MDDYYKLAEKILSELVSFNTTNKPGNEKPLAEYIASQMKRYGFQTEIQDIAENRSNVILDLGTSNNEVIFTGHLDVVPAGDNWKSGDPFHLSKEGDRLYGRGSCDMKGGIAAMLASAIKLSQEGISGNCTLKLVFVVDEETDGLGTKHYVRTHKPKDKSIVIIGEPTMLELNIAHRGVTRFRVKIYGKQCHSGRPYEGLNSIYLMSRFAEKVREFDLERQSLDCGILPPPNMTITRANSGISDNSVPGVADMVIDCRTVPGENAETLKESILDILHSLFDDTDAKFTVDCFIDVMPGSTTQDGRVATIVSNAFHNAFGEQAKITYFKGCCDMSAFTANGYEQTLLCGPGSLDQAHIIDEYIEIDQLHKAVDLYTEIFRQAERTK